MLVPRQKAPELTVDTLAHGPFRLAAEKPERMTLICFYRGLHCPICATYLKELERLTPSFAERGVATIAISSDDRDRATAMADKIGASHLRIGFGLPLADARQWGLYLSTSRGKTSIGIEEPALFSEPGVFLLKPDQTVYYLSIQSMPFVRPNFSELLQALDFIIKNDYPARGEYVGEV
ncbi:peroxiredoxin-like family protein [Paraburkholderia sp. 22099]|jgi:peroxiredoxin|uniref:Peroxiredoxin n=1 Tax=Paraburkholderia terricola TaxID=169427 RepID=A0A1M6NW37_9BURK|nr:MULTISPECIES: peroxiredoxin-like family protein [Paraburkholderia]MDR6445187.1 peroxiredoxin [Paraburkholderia terricola]ORC51790.1 alkyl hydroperoxide reductase [Burkholderia sp. A27]SDO20028.1 Peroxiredoxin [Paraburkholderia sediminicola]SHJ99905.1 Peroxiredoxin [Paraburkholderia terricola]